MSFLILIISLFCSMPLAWGNIKPIKIKELAKLDLNKRNLVAKITSLDELKNYPYLKRVDLIVDENKHILDTFTLVFEYGWLYFRRLGDDGQLIDYHPLKNQSQKAKMFNCSVYDLGDKFYNKIKDNGSMFYFLRHLAYEPSYQNTTHSDKSGLLKQEINKDTFAEFKQDAIEAMSLQYKIHLQVRPEYIISFVRDLFKLIGDHGELRKYIHTMKVAPLFVKGHHLPPDDKQETFHRIPVVVLYTVLIPGDTSKKKDILDKIFTILNARYQNVIKEIALRDNDGEAIQPRYNYKVNDLMWIAGGNGDDKNYYKKYIKDNKLSNTVYTSDYAFFQGYEYSFTPQEKETKKSGSLLATALDTLKEKLKQLAYALSGKQEKKKANLPDPLMTLDIPGKESKIMLIKGSVLDEQFADPQTAALVTPAGPMLDGENGGLVDKKVHAKAGKELAMYCKKIIKEKKDGTRCSIGDARVTPSFGLNDTVAAIIHAVGPVKDTKNKKNKMENLYKETMRIADQGENDSINLIEGQKEDAQKITHIAFPAISTGQGGGYRKDEAAQIAVTTVYNYLKNTKTNIKEVRFVIFDNDDLKEYEKQIKGL